MDFWSSIPRERSRRLRSGSFSFRWKEWDPFLSTMGDEDGFLEVAYKYSTINSHSLWLWRAGSGERRAACAAANPECERDRSSSRLARRPYIQCHRARRQSACGAAKFPCARNGTGGTHIDAIVEMKNPGGLDFRFDGRQAVRAAGTGIVFEYAGQSGQPALAARFHAGLELCRLRQKRRSGVRRPAATRVREQVRRQAAGGSLGGERESVA